MTNVSSGKNDSFTSKERKVFGEEINCTASFTAAGSVRILIELLRQFGRFD